MPSDGSVRVSRLWHGKPNLVVLVLLALVLPIAYPGAGVIGSFVIAIVVVLIARKHGSFRDMGFRQPESWPRLLGTTLMYGFVIQLIFTMVVPRVRLISPLLSGK